MKAENKEKEKKERASVPLKWRLLIYFVGFAAAILGMLWLFQIVFLDEFYKSVKTNELNSSADIILRSLESDHLAETAEALAFSNELCILVLDTDGTVIASADTLPDCRIHKMRADELVRLYMLALSSGGHYTDNAYQTPVKVGVNHIYGQNQDIYQFTPYEGEARESIVSVYVRDLSDGNQRIVLLNSTISPVQATVRTLRIQLGMVTLVMLVLSFGLAFLISRRLSRPIARINEAAHELARGNYDIAFSERGYREIQELNDTLNKAADELSKVEGLRKELLANISHDLRTPLTMITGYGEMMRDIPGENTPENVQIIVDEATRLTRLVNDLLDLSKLQAGVQELSLSQFCLTGMIRDTIKRYAKLIQQEGYTVRFEAGSDVWVYADETKISQVLYNLINNALNYTGADKTVTVRQILTGDSVRIEVSDTGEGIAADKLPYVWERYYKLDRSHRRAAVGTGLGLSIVKNVLEMHKANYGADSTLGKGSTFWFELLLFSKNKE